MNSRLLGLVTGVKSDPVYYNGEDRLGGSGGRCMLNLRCLCTIWVEKLHSQLSVQVWGPRQLRTHQDEDDKIQIDR
jgi:hypothetical protein